MRYIDIYCNRAGTEIVHEVCTLICRKSIDLDFLYSGAPLGQRKYKKYVIPHTHLKVRIWLKVSYRLFFSQLEEKDNFVLLPSACCLVVFIRRCDSRLLVVL